MEKINFGFGISMPVRPEKRKLAEDFLRTILNCAETMRSEEYTCFRFPNGQIIGITPEKEAPSEEEYEHSIWLEIISEDFEATKKRIKEFGAREVTGGMKEAFFFNLPGGAVFRLLSEEMAKKEHGI
jgi:predicted enzyme related to lactoylglutathione lyase